MVTSLLYRSVIVGGVIVVAIFDATSNLIFYCCCAVVSSQLIPHIRYCIHVTRVNVYTFLGEKNSIGIVYMCVFVFCVV